MYEAIGTNITLGDAEAGVTMVSYGASFTIFTDYTMTLAGDSTLTSTGLYGVNTGGFEISLDKDVN